MNRHVPKHPEDLYRISHASIISKLFETAIEFEIFDLLSRPKTAAHLFEKTQIKPVFQLYFMALQFFSGINSECYIGIVIEIQM